LASERKRCFIIMPFSETQGTLGTHTQAYWTQHYNLLKKVIEELGDLDVHRSEPLRENILKAIVADLVVSDVVVAELTDFNANVFWELGVRQSFKHGTVTIAEHGTDLPFDQMEKATQFYRAAPAAEWEDFRTRLKAAVKDCLENPNKPDSPVLDNIAGRGTIFELFRKDETLRRIDALQSQMNHNSAVLANVEKNAKANQEKKKEELRAYSTGRFQIAATELLVTNRYLDEEPEFYDSVEVYYGWLVRLNSQLNFWEPNPDGTEKWLLNMIGNFNLKKLFSDMEENAAHARKEVETRV